MQLPLTQKSKPAAWVYAFYTVLLFFFLLTAAELTCRALGYKPYNAAPVTFECKPKLQGEPQALLGYGLVDGDFTVTKNDTFTYYATHRNKQRITGNSNNKHSKKLVFLGCSFTYGDCLNDTCTHPFILQQMLNKAGIALQVENRAVGGYGAAQFYLQAKEIIKDTTIETVIINYSSFQNDRVTCSRIRRKAMAPNIKQLKYINTVYVPSYTILHDTLHLQYQLMKYDFLPFQKQSALVELIDNAYCRFENNDSKKISLLLIQKTLDLLKANGKNVYLAPVTGDEESVTTAKELEAKAYKIIYYGINTGENQYNLMPADGNPNYAANKIFATRIFETLTEKK